MKYVSGSHRMCRILGIAFIAAMAVFQGPAFAQFDEKLDALPSARVLEIPSYDPSVDPIHPDVVYLHNAVGGVSFFMTTIPGDGGPLVLLSRDGLDWDGPGGSLIPVVTPSCTRHYEGPNLFWDESNSKFLLTVVSVNHVTGNQALRIFENDPDFGWWEDVNSILYDLSPASVDPAIASPSMVKADDLYYLFYVASPPPLGRGSVHIEMLTCDDGRLWDKHAATVVEHNLPKGVVPGELDVVESNDGWYYMLLTSGGDDNALYLGRSLDLKTWDFADEPLTTSGRLQIGPIEYFAESIGRSTGLVNSSMNLLYLWLSFETLEEGKSRFRTAVKAVDLSNYFPSEVISVPSDYATIQAAIDASTNGDTILVAPGTYELTSTIDLEGKNVVLMSTDGPRTTEITAANPSLDLVRFHGNKAAAALDGFTLRGGHIAVWCQISAPTIKHCLMVDQNITNWASVVLAGPRWGTSGPSPAILINNTIVNSRNGGISLFSTIPATIKNTIVTDCNYGVHHQGNMGTVPPKLDYNDIWNCPDHYYNCADTGSGTISANPLFDANYALSPGSPCIDAGDPNPHYNDPDGSRNDMGWLPAAQDYLLDVDEPATELPEGFELEQNYPNPFNPTTTIGFSLARSRRVELTIYNVMGRKVRTLHRGVLPAGYSSFDWNSTDESGRAVASGVYLYRLSTEDEVVSRKMLLLK